ncbi:NmrA family NAD(P)-binding protein [Algoriphagus resistens]|uniref:NmrA family NAD(P)-binding protein n=1 Tax=Algoriphagus resistens TaxID=1750590 RepID=UPI0007169623|nr:NmrA family NAD(P)-binding protein [Algoriphagus resistens]
MTNEILVLGATGKTGKRVMEKLQKMGIPVRAGSRNGTPPFDWDRSEGWASVVDGIQKVYLTYYPDFMAPGALEKIQGFVNTAKKSGVQQLVFLSGRGEKEAEEAERIVIDSGLCWTIVRSSWFMQNFSEFFFLDNILEGYFVIPKPKAFEPFVDLDDLAEVVVEALTDARHNGKIYELTGPELLSFKDTTRLISEAINRPIVYEEVDMNGYIKILGDYQIPEDIIWLMQYLFTEVLDGRNESITNDIEKVIGRKPVTFAEYVVKANRTGVWDIQH